TLIVNLPALCVGVTNPDPVARRNGHLTKATLCRCQTTNDTGVTLSIAADSIDCERSTNQHRPRCGTDHVVGTPFARQFAVEAIERPAPAALGVGEYRVALPRPEVGPPAELTGALTGAAYGR